jgi:hypothetical protein
MHLTLEAILSMDESKREMAEAAAVTSFSWSRHCLVQQRPSTSWLVCRQAQDRDEN